MSKIGVKFVKGGKVYSVDFAEIGTYEEIYEEDW